MDFMWNSSFFFFFFFAPQLIFTLWLAINCLFLFFVRSNLRFITRCSTNTCANSASVSPSGLCSWVCPITLISPIYTWTSAAVRYAPPVCAAPTTLAHLLHRFNARGNPRHVSLPLCLSPTVEVSRRRRDSGAVSSSFMCGDLRHLR